MPSGTFVTVDGKKMTRVRKITWSIDVDNVARVTLDVAIPRVELKAKKVIINERKV